jgi:hypothetical protein
MKTLLKPIVILSMIFVALSCNTDNKIELFNGSDLDNWNIIVSNDEVAPADLFYVKDGVMNTSGQPFGYIRTKTAFSNYQLHLEWRWTDKPANSGVLINVQGEEIVFPHCVECQLKEGSAGDIVLMGRGATIRVRDSLYTVTSDEHRYLSIPKLEKSSEKPAGEWNSYDITSLDGVLEVVVNGVLQNRGTDMVPSNGNIALQSEGGPLQFRNIYMVQL